MVVASIAVVADVVASVTTNVVAFDVDFVVFVAAVVVSSVVFDAVVANHV